MMQPDDVGRVSPLGRRYLDGELRGSQLQGDYEMSGAGDIPELESLPDDRRQELLRLGREQLPQAAYGVLAAGASSRMSLKDIPARVRELLEEAGRDELPRSKALVPVCKAGAVLTFLDLFLLNVRQFRQREGVSGPAVILTSEANHGEILAHIAAFDLPDVRPFQQPLAPQIAATPQDIQAGAAHFAADDLAPAEKASAELAGREILVGKPAGHGEFLHQLVSSGLLVTLAADGVEYLSVRNIDNVAALLDDAWITLLGYVAESQLDCLLEVCPRLPGQSGGALIRQDGQWRIAEDMSFRGTDRAAHESRYINNAVAIFRLDYFYKLYQTDAQELAAASPAALLEIADRGRRQFPVIVDAKPVRLGDRSVVGAITPETNMWESTGVVQGARIGAFGVPSEASLGEDFWDQPDAERQQRARQVRFSPTKTWADYDNPTKRAIVDAVARSLVGPDRPAD